jgi:hypothetical protein
VLHTASDLDVYVAAELEAVVRQAHCLCHLPLPVCFIALNHFGRRQNCPIFGTAREGDGEPVSCIGLHLEGIYIIYTYICVTHQNSFS